MDAANYSQIIASRYTPPALSAQQTEVSFRYDDVKTPHKPLASKMRLLQMRAMKHNQQKNSAKGNHLESFLENCSKSVLSMISLGHREPQRLPKYSITGKTCTKFRFLPSLGTTSFFTLITLICLEMILLSTVSNCAKTFYMHWNTSNSIFRIDNTDHIIDVNKGNLAFEFDQVHIICPVYEPGTFENETEKYIIYNVSKVEYETCRITNADPRVIAICDKPQKLMFFTITFRPFTPQPGGLEFLPGNDYYFISTSSKDDLYRRIGGRCSTNNMKVVFKVCCAPEEKNKTTIATNVDSSNTASETDVSLVDVHSSGNLNNKNNNQQHNTINTFGGVGTSGGGININSANNNGIQLKPLNVGGSTGTSINTNIDQFNRIPMQTNGINVIGHNIGQIGGDPHSGILLTPGGVGHGGINMIPASGGYNPGGIGGQYYPGQTTTGIRINNVPSQYQPSHKHNSNNNNDDHYDKHPNEVVKNEELTYNSAGSTIHRHCWNWRKLVYFKAILASGSSSSLVANLKPTLMKLENIFVGLIYNPLVLLTIFFVTIVQYQFFKTSYKSPCNRPTTGKRRSKLS